MGARENECQISQNLYILGKARFLLEGGQGIYEFFLRKKVFKNFFCPPTSLNRLMYDFSEIPKQKLLTLPPANVSKTKITGSARFLITVPVC